MPCGDAANTSGIGGGEISVFSLYQVAKTSESLCMFLFINQKSCPFETLQEIPF